MVAAGLAASAAWGAERTESFDSDPGWDAHNSRVQSRAGREVKQDFGFSGATAHCSTRGEIGGFIHPAAEPAYYAKIIPQRTFQDALSASGKLVCEGRQGNTLLGFFNPGTLGDWRTANTMALRVYGRGDVFYAYVEYATQKWRAGAGEFSTADPATGRRIIKSFRSGNAVHTWSLRYDPAGNGGNGVIHGKLDADELTVNVEPGHKSDGAVFNRFGLLNVMKHYDTGGELWLDDLSVNGEVHAFAVDPGWEGSNNRRAYQTLDVRPWFDFGFNNTHFAGGKAPGELGGLLFRGDGRDPKLLAYYGDRLDALDLNQPLKASGTVALRRAVSDSDTLIGFFHAAHSLESGGTDAFGTPPDFLGVRIGGPSREGFFFAPAIRIHGSQEKSVDRGAYIYPDSAAHAWTLEYDPAAANGRGQIVVALDGVGVRLDLEPGLKMAGAHFNRFGLITTHRDGNGQRIYFDDLTYTKSPR